MSVFTEWPMNHFHFLSVSRCRSLLQRHHTNLLEPLPPDELGLLYACLALGRYSEMHKHKVVLALVDEVERDDVQYFRHALAALDAWGGASCTALRGSGGARAKEHKGDADAHRGAQLPMAVHNSRRWNGRNERHLEKDGMAGP